MPDQMSMDVRAPNGKTLTITGDHIPTADELQQIFAQAGVQTAGNEGTVTPSADVGPQRLPPQPLTIRGTNTQVGQINPDLVELAETLRQRESHNAERSKTEAADVASKLPRALQWPAGAALELREPAAQIGAVLSGAPSVLGAAKAIQASGGGALAALRTTYANANPVMRQAVVLAVSRTLGIPSKYAEVLMLGAGLPTSGAAAAPKGAPVAAPKGPPIPPEGPTAFNDLPLAVQMSYLPEAGPTPAPRPSGGPPIRVADPEPLQSAPTRSAPVPAIRTSNAFATPEPQAVAAPAIRTSNAFATPEPTPSAPSKSVPVPKPGTARGPESWTTPAERIDQLAEVRAKLPDSTHEFVDSLISQARQGRTLSKAQWDWVDKLITRASEPPRHVADFLAKEE